MPVSTPIPQGKAEAETATVHQVYLTHCVPADSVRNEAGFSVRAASTRDAELLQFALDYPGLELPIDMWGSEPSPEKAPRRLALVQAPRGRTALVHSSYLPRDTCNRPGNYFTHILFYPSLSLADALEAWGSSDWALDYRQGESKDLKPFARPRPAPPRQGKLDREALTRFLAAARFPRDSNLATTVCPERLLAHPEQRQQLVRMALLGCLLVLREGANGARRNLYLLAEPGLAALLLYAVARLLPGRQVAGLTFSTYEPGHRSFRQFKGAQILCTFLENGDKGLDNDHAQTRGYALDTFHPERSSPDLLRDFEPLRELLGWAAAGDWDRVAELHRRHGAGPVSLETLRFARQMVELSRQLQQGQASLEQLRSLLGSAQGQAFLEEHEDGVWKLAFDACLAVPAARKEWDWLLRKRLADLKTDAGRHLSPEGWERWERAWGLLADLRRAEPEKLRGDFLEILRAVDGGAGGPERLHDLSERLLRQWASLGSAAAELPEEIRKLLAPATPAELDRLASAGLPTAWVALALHAALEQDATRARALAAIGSADGPLQAAFFAEVAAHGPEDDRVKFLLPLLAPDGKTDETFLGMLLAHGNVLPAESLFTLLNKGHAFARPRLGFWVATGRLGRLFELLQGTAPAKKLWEHYGGLLKKDVLLGDETQRALLTELRAAHARQPEAVPEPCAQAVSQWGLLADLCYRPGDIEGVEPKDVRATLKGRGLDEAGLLRERFARCLQDRPPGDADYLTFVALVDKLGEQWASLNDCQRQARLFDLWLKATDGCADADRKADHQLYYFRERIDPPWQPAVAKLYSRGEQKKRLAEQAVVYLKKAAREKPGASRQGEAERAAAEGEAGAPALWERTWVKVAAAVLLFVGGVIVGLLLHG